MVVSGLERKVGVSPHSLKGQIRDCESNERHWVYKVGRWRYVGVLRKLCVFFCCWEVRVSTAHIRYLFSIQHTTLFSLVDRLTPLSGCVAPLVSFHQLYILSGFIYTLLPGCLYINLKHFLAFFAWLLYLVSGFSPGLPICSCSLVVIFHFRIFVRFHLVFKLFFRDG